MLNFPKLPLDEYGPNIVMSNASFNAIIKLTPGKKNLQVNRPYTNQF